MSNGYIYVMSHPSFKDLVKIGSSKDVYQRLNDLSNTLPEPYVLHVRYATKVNLKDKELHKLIDEINPTLRYKKNREWFRMTPQQAYRLLKSIATITNTEKMLELIDKTDDNRFKLSKIGIKKGEVLSFRNHKNVKCTVLDDKHVIYNGKKYSLSKLALKLLKEIENKEWKTARGALYFEYKGKNLLDI